MQMRLTNYYKFSPLTTLIIGCLISLLVAWYTYNNHKQKQYTALEIQSKEIVILIQKRMAAYEQVLKSGIGLFKSSDNVSRNEWRIFSQENKLNENFKGIQGFGYSEIVLPKEKQKYEERIKKEGFADFKIRPEGERELYTSIIYLEPFDERNQRAFGYDMFSEKNRREAMTKAIQSGNATLSGKIKLVQEFDTDVQAGFLMYLPLYKKGFKLDTAQDRTLAIQGFVYAAFRANDLMNGILANAYTGIDFEIYDGNLASEENLIYDSNPQHDVIQAYKKINITINGYNWTLVFKQYASLVNENFYMIFLIPSFILLLSLLLYLLLNSLIKTKENALEIAKNLTQELSNSEERLRFSLEGSGDGLWDWNIKTDEVYFSKRWKEMLGFKEDEIENSLDEWKNRIHPKDIEKVYADITKHLEGKSHAYRNEHRVKCKDGSYKWILDRGMIVSRDADGLAERMVGSHSDISKSKEYQHKIEKYLDIIDINVIYSTTDLKGTITYASQAFCDISSYTKEELIGNNHRLIRHPEMPDTIYKELWETIKAGEIWEGEIKNKRKDGGFYWVKTKVAPEYDAEKNIVAYSSIRHDITSQKAKEDFMANMSHELRTPLNAIIGFSSILNKKQTDAEHQELSSIINKSAASLLVLINDILDLAKIKSSHFSIDPYEFDAYTEFKNFSHQFEGLCNTKVLNYKVNLDDALQGIFFGDWKRISQIILNLTSNAIKFTPDNGTINVSGDYKDGLFILSVSDNGIGMNKETQDKVFEPFTQADGSTTRKYGGTGLGLSITQDLVTLMNGKIELESLEGVGTTFKVTLPLEKLHEELEDSQSQSSQEDTDDSLIGHILIVEDNKTNQMLVKILIEDFGLTCDIANDGLEAVAIYQPQKHQVVLMDENMPNMNGIEAMLTIREKYKEKTTPIIALTANAMQGDRERFLNLGMDGYISKPIDEKQLYETLKEFL